VQSEERALLWTNLRERALSAGSYQAPELPEEALEPALLALLGGWDNLSELPVDTHLD
jgi:hypothetical protein